MKLTTGTFIAIVARNVVPIAGIAYFGWKPSSLLVVYYVDTMVFFAGSMISGYLEEDSTNNALEILIATCGFGAILGAPVLVTGWDELQFDRYLAVACVAQAAVAGAAYSKLHRELRLNLRREFSERRRQALRNEAGDRFLMMLVRWLATIFAMWPPAMVAVYAVLTLYFDLRPLRFLSKPR